MNIKVACSSNQGLSGVARIDTIDIEMSDGKSNNELSDRIFNTLAEREYFVENDGWEKQLKKDIVEITRCDLNDIEIE